jgi:transmembrane sensor
MNATRHPELSHEALREAAAAWHERLNSEKASDALHEEFQQWLSASPHHREAYDAVERTWSALRGVAHDPQILALRHETALRLTRRVSERARPLRWAAAAMIAIVALVLSAAIGDLASRMSTGSSTLSWISGKLGLSRGEHYTTATGERLNVALNDGSQVTLNTQTEMRVVYTKELRSVRLARGQALFEVAKDPGRPFVVEVQDRRFVAVGTAFDVRIDGEEVRVTMLAGTVRAQGADSPAVTMVSAGEQLTAATHGRDEVRRADAERVTSWRRGQVVFEDTRLADAVREVNRYSDTRIELKDPQLGDLRLSGAFATGATNVFVEAITSYFPIVADRENGGRLILRAR